MQLGVIVGLVTWLWVCALDVLAGTPFATIRSLGGAATFSVIHFALCLAYGIGIVAAVHAAMRTPSVVFAMVFCTILFHGAFVMLTALLGQLGPGDGAWSRFLVGNIIAAAVTWVLVTRRHPLGAILHRAEAES